MQRGRARSGRGHSWPSPLGSAARLGAAPANGFSLAACDPRKRSRFRPIPHLLYGLVMATEQLEPDDRYTVISVDGHAGADRARVQAVPRVALARRVRRLGRGLRQPVRRPARADRVPQLGQRPPARRDRVERRRRRGAVPQHRAAVLRAGQPHRARTDRRRLRTPLGGPAGAQPLARRLLRGGARPARRCRAGVPQRSRRHARRDPLGDRSTSTCSAASCCRTSRPTRRFAPLWDPVLRTALGPLRRARRRRATSTPAAACPTSASTRPRGRSCSSSSRGSRTGPCGT